MSGVTFEQVKNNEEINAFITQGNKTLGVLGYTEHSQAHALIVSKCAAKILSQLGYSKKDVELVRIAGYMHDIGNCVNRNDHAHNGAILARQILNEMGMKYPDIAVIMNAIGVHDENTGGAVDPVSAALIIADKTDVRRNRVRQTIKEQFDKHDRVNYAVVGSNLTIRKETKEIRFSIELDESICSMMDYFEIFITRMLMCKRASELLGMTFKMKANGNKIC